MAADRYEGSTRRADDHLDFTAAPPCNLCTAEPPPTLATGRFLDQPWEANVSYDLVEIAGRVQRLERDNRRLKLGAGGLVALVVAVPLVGAVLPAQGPEVIEARAFRVLDEQGELRALLNEDGLRAYDEQGTVRAAVTAGGLGFHDEQGTTRAALFEDGLVFSDEQGELRAAFEDVALAFYHEQGPARATLRADGLGFRDEQGAPRAVFDAGSLFFNDEKGTTRLQLGRITLVNPSTKAETKYPASSVVLFDEEGNVIESLPR